MGVDERLSTLGDKAIEVDQSDNKSSVGSRAITDDALKVLRKGDFGDLGGVKTRARAGPFTGGRFRGNETMKDGIKPIGKMGGGDTGARSSIGGERGHDFFLKVESTK